MSNAENRNLWEFSVIIDKVVPRLSILLTSVAGFNRFLKDYRNFGFLNLFKDP